jgi:hypothetical protein
MCLSTLMQLAVNYYIRKSRDNNLLINSQVAL